MQVFETHLAQDELERYAMAIGPDPLGEEVEEHLLMCTDCCEILHGLEEEIAALRIALRETEPESGHFLLRGSRSLYA